MQWGSDALGFVQHLLTHWSQLPILVIATIRDEAVQVGSSASIRVMRLVGLNRTTTLALGPLAKDAHAQMIESRLALGTDIIERLEERTRGNPLFTEEIVRHWIQSGVLIPGADGFTLRSASELRLPAQVSSVWDMRIRNALDGAPADGLELLELAAVLGQTFVESELLEACQGAGLILESTHIERWRDGRLILPLSPSRWTFVHGLLREALQQSAKDHARWQSMNRVCAEMLAARNTGSSERIGEHFLAAGYPEASFAPFIQAAELARRRSDYRRAQRFIFRAAQCVRQAGWGRQSLQWAELLGHSAICLRVQGQFELAIRRARSMKDLADGHTDVALQARALLEVARCVDVLQNAEESIPYYQQACELAEKSEEFDILLTCLNGLSRAYRLVSDYQRSMEVCALVIELGQEKLIPSTTAQIY